MSCGHGDDVKQTLVFERTVFVHQLQSLPSDYSSQKRQSTDSVLVTGRHKELMQCMDITTPQTVHVKDCGTQIMSNWTVGTKGARIPWRSVENGKHVGYVKCNALPFQFISDSVPRKAHTSPSCNINNIQRYSLIKSWAY